MYWNFSTAKGEGGQLSVFRKKKIIADLCGSLCGFQRRFFPEEKKDEDRGKENMVMVPMTFPLRSEMVDDLHNAHVLSFC